jgi:hypothetical protein
MRVTDRETLAIAPGLGAAALGAGLYAWLMRAPVGFANSPICGHHLGEFHCPACYAAAGMVIVGLAASLLATRRAPMIRLRA